ncbi:oxidoreductase, zinc-binding dehydrogenase family protein [Leptospira inadai serovar Lyme str. 10]|uniref:Oxidoreductase, zinc-binding dehydrogenase family protein n=2 Tax=Leptospira inadai serovar Lyme TaxID=293084 RepID=V6HC21_9LEPT|nr:NADP-dependent oxidoreductase [Leptospira inadai]EQA36303.1 oxidoreductase, zinc-binding dehydrogenase family protein [Leptospira inadai serovar Lyme str. 10]PNV75492.1 NADP-dependent oxidoreductase [Leptospira inadai serovar Lyme]
MINHQYRLAARPVGLPKQTDWTYTEEPTRSPSDGEILVKILYISLDPAMRGWMNDVKSYVPPVRIGEVMRAGAIGKIIESKHPDFKIGEYVYGIFGVQEYAVSNGKGVTKVDPSLAPLPTYLGTLGMPGMTAYFGLLDVGKAKSEDVVVVSGAAGAVGMLVGQIAKIKGCRVIGIAGGSDKCKYIVDELGFDAAIDYKSEDVKKSLRKHCLKGIDVYFDNVGGEILDAAMTRLAKHARIVICGAISQYNNTEAPQGPRNYMALLVSRARMEGFVVFDYEDRYAEAIREMSGWMAEEKLKSREDIVKGLSTFPETLLQLFKGGNTGKLVLEVASD